MAGAIPDMVGATLVMVGVTLDMVTLDMDITVIIHSPTVTPAEVHYYIMII